jgi:protocatechuate 3,4-dioxygenase beta subunit
MMSALVLAFLALQDPPTPQPQAEKPKADCVIKGQVLNAVTGEPLRKARVQLMKANSTTGPRERDTDTAGRFEFRAVEPGRYSLSAERTGFVNQSYGSRKPGGGMGGTMIALAPAQEMKDLAIKLSPQAVIIGRVIDEDGDPMADINVSAMRWTWQGKRRQLMPAGNANTNDLGEYRMYGLAPDSYYVQATRQDYGGGMRIAPEPPSGKPEEGYVATWYPGTTDATTAPRVTVKGGSELRGVDIRMAKSRVVRIHGTIISSANGKPVSGNIMMMPRKKGTASWMEMKHSFVPNPTDGFDFRNITPGTYLIRAQTGYGTSRDETETVQQIIEVGESNIDNLVLRPTPGIEIRGKLTIEGAKIEGERATVSLQQWDDEDEPNFGGGWAEVKEDGTFAMKNVQAGRYRVNTFRQGTYIKSARAGDQDLLNSPLDTTQGGPSSLDITLSANAPEVTGSVKDADGKPLPGMSVILIPNDESWRRQWNGYGSTTTDQYGNFRVTGVRPGEYKAISLEEIEGGEYMDPEFIKRYDSKATPVSLKEGSKEDLQLTLVPSDTAGAGETR